MKKYFTNKIIISFLVIIIFLGGLFFLRNLIAEYLIVNKIAENSELKIKVSGLDLDLFHSTVSWENLEITKSDISFLNNLEFKKGKFAIQLKPLFVGKVIIDKLFLDNIVIKEGKDSAIWQRSFKNSKKHDNSKFSTTDKAILKLNQKGKETVPFYKNYLTNKADIENIIAELELKTPAKIDSLRQIVEQNSLFWQKKFKEEGYENELKGLIQEISKIKTSKLKKVKDIKKAHSKIKKTTKRAKKIRKLLEKDKELYSKDLVTLQNLGKEIPNWIKEDYSRHLRKANLVEYSIENMAYQLYGDKITFFLNNLLNRVENIRESVKKISEPKLEIPRLEKMAEYPKLWIKQIIFSLQDNNGEKINGEIFNLSSDQVKIKQPLTFKISGEYKSETQYYISSIFDYRTAVSKEIIDLEVKNIKLPSINLSSFSLLPQKILKGVGNMNANIMIAGESINAKIKFLADNIRFDYKSIKDVDNKFYKLSRSIARKVKQLDVFAELKFQNEKLDLHISSNIDELVIKEIKETLASKNENKRELLLAKIDTEIDKEVKKFDKLLMTNEDLIKDIFIKTNTSYDLSNKNYTKLKKNIEKRLKKLIKKKLKKLKF